MKNKNELSVKSILQCNSQRNLLFSSRETSWQKWLIKSVRSKTCYLAWMSYIKSEPRRPFVMWYFKLLFLFTLRMLRMHRHPSQFGNVSFNSRLENTEVRKRTHTIAKSGEWSASTLTLLSLHYHLPISQVLNIFPFVPSWIKSCRC